MAPRRALAMIGDLIYDATGQSGLNTRVLPDGRVEQSFQHTGKFWGEQGREIATAVSMWRPDGSFSFEVNGYFFTKGGESVSFKGQGVGWPTGAGWKASRSEEHTSELQSRG